MEHNILHGGIGVSEALDVLKEFHDIKRLNSHIGSICRRFGLVAVETMKLGKNRKMMGSQQMNLRNWQIS